MARTSPSLRALEIFGLLDPNDNVSDAIKAKAAEADKGFAALSSASRPLGTSEVSDNLEALDDYERRAGIDQGIRARDLESQIGFKGALQGQQTAAKNAQQDNLTKNSLELMALPAGVLDQQSKERSANVDKMIAYGKSQDAAAHELQRRALTQDMLGRIIGGLSLFLS